MGTVTMLIAFPFTILSASFPDVWEVQKRLSISETMAIFNQFNSVFFQGVIRW